MNSEFCFKTATPKLLYCHFLQLLKGNVFCPAEVCPYGGELETLDVDNHDSFTVTATGLTDGKTVLGDAPVPLSPGATIVIKGNESIKPEYTVMDLEMTVSDVTTVTIKFYGEDGSLLKTVTVSKSAMQSLTF